MADRSNLKALQARLEQDLGWLNLPAAPWVARRPEHPADILDVAVIGAGLLGLVACAALRNIGINKTRAFDRADKGMEGPWITSARMQTLRTRKEAAGPALGIPSLTFRAWFEAQFGREAFTEMNLIPRQMWMDYLVWYRAVLHLDVANGTTLQSIALRDDGLLELSLTAGEVKSNVLARRVVLATGIDGLGAPALPAVAASLPSGYVAHSSDIIDMATLRGKRVAVVGAGASAMDNAAAALEAGAERVDIFIRRAEMPRVDKFTGVGSRGMTHGYVGLPDETKWHYMVEGERAQIPPPRHSVLRVSRHANAHFHLASPIEALSRRDDAVEIVTPKGRYRADFMIFATGFSVDVSQRPELALLKGKIRRWRDVYEPPETLRHEGLAEFPYLGPGFELLPAAGAPAGVSNIFCFAYPAVLSHGKITSGIPSISDGAQRLSQAIARSLFVEDRDLHLQSFHDFAVPELKGDEWQDSDMEVTA